MTERGQQVKKDYQNQKMGSDQSEFPIVCETCLGDNPYIRMTKQPQGDQCRICKRPYTVFRWKAGTKGRFKRCEICQTCAKVKNVCQTCIFDLQYGLPVQVRDKFLGDNKVVLPQSAPNRDWFIQEQQQNLDKLVLPYNSEETNPILAAQAQIQKNNYKRNLTKVCSFWEKGECTRGDLCPYAHEKRHDKESSLAKQNIRDRFHGNNDVLAKNMLDKIMERQEQDVTPPEDVSITSIFLRNLPDDINEQELGVIFSRYGTISSIKLIKGQHISFINFASRTSAEQAVNDNYGNLIIKGNKIVCTWARPKALKNPEQKGVMQYQQELEKMNAMINPQQITKVPPPPGQQQQEKIDAAQKLAEILNPEKKTQEQLYEEQQQKQSLQNKPVLIDYSDDEEEENKKQE